ncbi:bacillithiol biosynthesis deacetylase BshB1 [Riemerella anatipestifer]|uniref:Bacillithiol biosynthesis deacetylase BshB1 n=1 Tax=Riemerella anatipestifer TaxID=34085 RepID=A0AAP3AL46_RIEAN|nr:bacillithiol biosynthesis deacetylase BshB1 [Riemerella anatipestifer]AZZ59084.1 bacillithiol biosynthesis deacetylase BshB1 [Riemerella anatipestifer]MBT0562604.1 bacillithiol biosynthesis deacetylase BshB1 [Riemerella anatipestifer]MBT0573589.1 bacillithiol biosynthesis deacetylase BshB1 [Riemerella anatipestifer]MCO7318639.1 bacillithiol biosynthesis deacetylase BshB1 [Riemerella anatipestifer]MCQ4154953.1 bacillithiol biosynthesis deacetylase BshB1 [Riemerella anatipestifer]
MKVDILAIGAHPDDVELGCGGTLAKFISQGKKVAIVDLTEGELGTRGTNETRAKEAKRASNILGVVARENLGMKDGFLSNTEEYQMRIVKMVRKYQPEIIFANAIDDRHPDHAKAAKLVSDACFLSGLIKIETVDAGETQPVWRPKHIFNYIQWKSIKPDFVVDISDFMDKKIEACLAYETQFYNPNSEEPMTPISTKDFLESLTYRAQDLGRLSGVSYAEGFTSEKLIAFKNFDSIIL